MPQRRLEHLWDLGQRHLGAGRYVSARRLLESAEALAWRQRDARSLARLYLPLLETRRQIRYLAVEGPIFITESADSPAAQRLLAEFLQLKSGTLIAACQSACKFAGSVEYAQRRTGANLESLVLITHGSYLRLCPLPDATFAAGLPVTITRDADRIIQPNIQSLLDIPLPPPGRYEPNAPLHTLARESLLIGWEALALRWQSRHPIRLTPWTELAWLRLALRIDPACEPVTMRLMALAEQIERSG